MGQMEETGGRGEDGGYRRPKAKGGTVRTTESSRASSYPPPAAGVPPWINGDLACRRISGGGQQRGER